MRGSIGRSLVALLSTGIPASTMAVAVDFSIPGNPQVFQDRPTSGEESLDTVVGMDRAGPEGFYLLYDSTAYPMACLSRDRRRRIPVMPNGGTTPPVRPPVVAADSDVVYSDQRYYQGASFNREGFSVFRFRCGEETKQFGNLSYIDPARVYLTYDPEFTTQEPYGPMIAWDQRICVVTREAIGCASLADAQPVLKTLVTVRQVAAAIAHPPFYDVPDWTWSMGIQSTFQDLFPGEYSFETQPWGFELAAALPDGRMVVLLKSAFQEPLPARVAYLVRLGSDGQVEEVLHGPSTEWRVSTTVVQEQTNRRHPLLGVTGMAWDAEDGVVWLWPWADWDWAEQKAFLSDGGVVQGFAGTGALGVRPDGTGFFYLPLSAALTDSPYERLQGVSGTGGANAANRVPDLREFVPLDGPWARIAISRPTSHRFVRWNPATLDRDQDGLTAEEEARLGLDDWRWDSDGDGLSDGAEAGLGLDPTRDEGILANRAFDKGSAGFAESPWFATFRLPEAMPRWTGQKRFAANPGMNGPFCIERTCYFPDGMVMPLSHDIGAISIDGRWAIDPGGAVRTDLWTGATRPWLDPPFDWVRTGLAWYVENAESAYVVVAPGNISFTQVVHIDGSGQRRVLLESGLDPTPPVDLYPKPHRGAAALWPVGYHLESRTVLVAAQGAWDSWLLAVSARQPPAILERAQGMTRQNRHVDQGTFGTAWGNLLQGSFPNGFPFPVVLHGNGQGDYWSDRWLFGAWLEDGRIGESRDFLGADRLDQIRLVGGFGDVLLDSQTGSEIVTIPRRVSPGDVLAFGRLVDGGMMLFRVGPRGGLATLWPSPRRGYNFHGMGASPAGRVCLAADPGEACPDGCVAEFSPEEEGRGPGLLTGLIGGKGYRDCAYENDDTILAWRMVAEAPPGETSRVERWRRQGGTFVKQEETVIGPVSLQGFVEGPQGPVLVPDDQVVVAMLDDGQTISFSVGSEDRLRSRLEQSLEFRGVSVLDATARPDGFVIALVRVTGSSVYPEGTYLVAYRPDQDRFARVLRYGGDEGIVAIARVPGGVGRDPWSWAGPEDQEHDGPENPQSGSPLGPPVPSFGPGEEVPVAGGGCVADAVPGPRSWLLVALMVSWLLRRRGQASRPRR